MDSSAFVADKTFPIDFNESSNPDLLTEVTYGEVGISPPPMMEKSSTGRMSPVRGRTMKEYDQQMAELKKENFNLKLRIYFMEERMNTKYSEEDVLKTNIELKVEMENYKKDILDKQALLEKASETIDTLTTKYSEQLEREVINIKQDCDNKVQEADQRVFDAEQELATLADKLENLEQECSLKIRPALQEKDKQIHELTVNLEERDKEIGELENKVRELKLELAQIRGEAEKKEAQLTEEMEALKTNLGRQDRDIQDAVEDTKRSLEIAKNKCAKQEVELERRSKMIGKLEDLLRTKEKEKLAVRKAYDERTEVYNRSKEVIQEMVKEARDKAKQIESLENDVQALQAELGKAQEDLQQANIQRQQDADKASELEQHLERLVRTLGKKDGELDNFRDLLQKAQDSLTVSEEAIELLQKELEKERATCTCKDKFGNKINKGLNKGDNDVARLQKELDDLHLQLKEREKQYQSKCAELDSVAERLNINVTSQSSNTDQSDVLAKIMGEIQHLKGAVESNRYLHIDISSTHLSSQSDASTHPDNTRSQHDLDNHITGQGHQNKPHIVGRNGSRFPVRNSSSISFAPDDLEALQNQVAELTAKNLDLANTLKATEETVHCQTQKMKQYRNMLVEHGLLPKPGRSNSVPNITMLDKPNDWQGRPSRRSLDGSSRSSLDVAGVHSRCRSVSPTPLGRRPQAASEYSGNIDRLMKEIDKLKQQVEGYRRVLKVFQSRCPSPGSDADTADGGPAPISSESASCLLEAWIDMVDKFLLELSQSDQEGQVQLATSNTVSRLRRGLVQARGAIQTLSEASLATQEKLSEGRLSPDSGCSDNPTSALNTLKDSLPNSPRGHKSPSTSPRPDITSPGSEAGSHLSLSTSDKLSEAGSPTGLGQDFVDCDDFQNRYQSTGSRSSRSQMSYNSDFSQRSRDAGQCPKYSNRDNTFQSVERLRTSTLASQIDLSVFSVDEIDGSIASSGPDAQTLNLVRNRNAYIPDRTKQNGASLNSGSSKTVRKPCKFDKTFSQSFLSSDHELSVADITAADGIPVPGLIDGTLLEMTLSDSAENKVNTEEMQERIKQLEKIIESYEDQIKQQSQPNMDSLQQQLIELRNLRIQLERSMARNEALEKQLMELYRLSEMKIKDLQYQLAEKEDSIKEKVHIIIEKEKVITETTNTLTVLRDNSARDSAELSTLNDRVKSLEADLKTSKDSGDQLRNMCQQLKNTVEQHKKRSEQLDGDNKKHMEAVFRHQNKVKDLEEELKSKSAVSSEVNTLKSRLHDLENDAHQWQENEAKYKHLLSQTRLQVTNLTTDVDMLKDELGQRHEELKSLSEELERSRDMIEEQNQHLCDNTNEIDHLKKEVQEKTAILEEQDVLCKDLTSKLENMNSVNGKLSTQLEQQRLTCADYKRQIEKQNQLTKDLKDRIDKMREELSQGIHNRESQEKIIMEKEKEIQETSKQRDKYLHNLKLTYKEFQRVKKELKEAEKKIEDTSALNSTLQTELSVRERLQEKGDMLTDDDKYNMIQELLKELKLARIQMATILEQNESIKQRMIDLIDQMKHQQSGEDGNQASSNVSVDVSISNRSLTEEKSNTSLDGNMTWPMYGDLASGLGRTDNLSCSLPVRESTPGAPASRNRQSDFPSQNTRQSGSSSHQSRKSDLPSQHSRQTERTSQQHSRESHLFQTPKYSEFSHITERDSSKHSEFSHITERDSSKSFSCDLDQGDTLSSSFDNDLNPPAQSNLQEARIKSAGNHFSVPGPIYKQGISDQCLLYNVNDSPRYLQGLTQVRIDSDVRSLFAIGMMDHFEKLRKETQESKVILKGVNTRIQERLKVFATIPATESVEYSTLKELSYAADNLRVCVDSQMSQIECFWTSELPAPNERGEFVNQKLLDQNAALREEICALRGRLSKEGSKTTLSEEQICKSLESTLDVVTRAKHNLQYQRSPSHSPRH